MSGPDDEFHVRPGRPRDGGTKGRQAKSFVGQVLRAANKGGRGGRAYSPRRKGGGASRFGRGRVTAPRRARRSSDRRVVVKMRIVRHQGVKYRAAPLARHASYLERERSEEHTSEHQSLMRISYAVFCLKKKNKTQ